MRIVLSFLLLLSSLYCYAQPTIAELEHYLRTDIPGKKILEARRDVNKKRVSQREIEAGWRLFGQATSARTQEIATADSVRRYTNNTIGLGASYPLLGARDRLLQTVASAQLDAQIDALNVDQYQREQLRLLRLGWLNGWIAQEKILLASEILKHEAEAQKILLERQKSGLLLESDRLETLSLFQIARRVLADTQQIKRESLSQIENLSSIKIPASFSRPDLAQTTLPDDWENPLKSLQVAVNGAQAINSLSGDWRGIDAQFQVGANIGKETWASGQTSHTVYTSLVVSFPSGISDWRESRNGELQARVNEQEQLLIAERDRRTQLKAVLEGEIIKAQADVDFQAYRETGARALLREKTLRMDKLAGDVYEQWLRAYTQLNIIQFDLLNAWQRLQAAHIELANLTATRLTTKHIRTEMFPIQDIGFYVWNVASLLKTPDLHLDALERTGTKRLLLSMTPEQLSIPTLADDLNSLINKLHSRGIRAEWLLGEPGWIRKAERQKLLSLLHKMHAIPFDGLHLDFEVEQLPEWNSNRNATESAWISSVADCIAYSSWPVAVSMHPRHLNNPELMGNLKTIGVQEIVVMKYVTNWQDQAAAIRLAKTIAPDIQITLALSVELDQSPEISYYHHIGKLKDDYRDLVINLNFAPPLLIQSWEDWERRPL